jgi:putative transposase
MKEDGRMKRSKYTEEQIAFALRQAETGTGVEEICRKFGISQATFYNWKKKYGGLGVSELRRLKQLEAENARLKKLVADLSLDKEMLQDVIQKSSEASLAPGAGPSHGRGLPVQQATRGEPGGFVALVLLLRGPSPR